MPHPYPLIHIDSPFRASNMEAVSCQDQEAKSPSLTGQWRRIDSSIRIAFGGSFEDETVCLVDDDETIVDELVPWESNNGTERMTGRLTTCMMCVALR